MYTVYLYYKDEKDPKIYEGFNTLKEAINFCKINKELIDNIELYKICSVDSTKFYNKNLHEIPITGFHSLDRQRQIGILFKAYM